MPRPTHADATVAVGSGRPPREPGSPFNAPITLATALVPGGPSEYTRHGNPTWASFEESLGALEGGQTVAFASGMAATSAVLDLVPTGGIVVAPRNGYYGTLALLADHERRETLQLRLVDVADTSAVIAAAEGASLVWLESPTNPALEVVDIQAVCAEVTLQGSAVVVDNTFATPLRQKPLSLGADFVVHSASKLLAGHSDVVLGAVVTNDAWAHEAVEGRRSATGSIPGALETYLAVRGLRTLHIRLDRAEHNAHILADRLAADERVEEVRYPGFGTIVCLELVGGAPAAQRVTEASGVIAHATSLGGVESTWERRRRHAGESPQVPEGLIRLSVGIEDVEDLWNDILSALAAA